MLVPILVVREGNNQFRFIAQLFRLDTIPSQSYTTSYLGCVVDKVLMINDIQVQFAVPRETDRDSGACMHGNELKTPDWEHVRRAPPAENTAAYSVADDPPVSQILSQLYPENCFVPPKSPFVSDLLSKPEGGRCQADKSYLSAKSTSGHPWPIVILTRGRAVTLRTSHA